MSCPFAKFVSEPSFFHALLQLWCFAQESTPFETFSYSVALQSQTSMHFIVIYDQHKLAHNWFQEVVFFKIKIQEYGVYS